jgi:hypothetical protein
LGIQAKHATDAAQEAQLDYDLAQALWASHGDRQQARQKVERARSLYASADARYQPQVEQMARWLKTHR